MEEIKVTTKKKLVSSLKRAFIIFILLVAGSYFFVSKKVFFGVFIGGVLSLLNIVVLSVIGEKVFKQKNPRKTLVIISYLIKIIILFGVLYFLISHEVINIFAFIAGFSIMILIIGFGIFFSSQHND